MRGEMRGFDPVAGKLSFGSTADGDPVSLGFFKLSLAHADNAP